MNTKHSNISYSLYYNTHHPKLVLRNVICRRENNFSVCGPFFIYANLVQIEIGFAHFEILIGMIV